MKTVFFEDNAIKDWALFTKLAHFVNFGRFCIMINPRKECMISWVMPILYLKSFYHLFSCLLQVNPTGEAAKTSLCVGDRILKVNDKDMRTAMHHDAVNALVTCEEELKLMVRHDPPPPGIKVFCYGLVRIL